ncbi:MAG TPA: hypothetical protein VKH35_15920 [Thermoanaerobaculia bacterium]|nr:hypothetical protein [Thermoanaerobaculia bacterium]
MIALFAALLAATAIHSGNVNALVDHVLDAYGGAAAWSNVYVLRESGTVVPAMASGNGSMTRTWKRPDSLRVEIVYPSRTETRTVEGDRGTHDGKAAGAMELDAMRLQAARLALPYLLVERRTSVRDLGLQNGRHRLEVPLGGSLSLIVEIDPGSGRIVHSVSKANGIEFSTDYSEFRMQDSLLFAFREENSAQGTPTGTNELRRIEVNPLK